MSKVVKSTRRMTVHDLTPEILGRIRNKTGNVICGITIPKFNFNWWDNVNFCEEMTFINALNISGECGKKRFIRFPHDEQLVVHKEEEYYNYNPRSQYCIECACPPMLRDKCVYEYKEKAKVKKIIKKKVVKKIPKK